MDKEKKHRGSKNDKSKKSKNKNQFIYKII
jgi:hypothetical protein